MKIKPEILSYTIVSNLIVCRRVRQLRLLTERRHLAGKCRYLQSFERLRRSLKASMLAFHNKKATSKLRLLFIAKEKFIEKTFLNNTAAFCATNPNRDLHRSPKVRTNAVCLFDEERRRIV